MDDTSFLICDPREEAGFVPELFPLANGQASPALNASDNNDRIKIEFLSLYYWSNRAYARLREARAKSGQGSDAERYALEQIERILCVRDGLEDKYAPYGIIAEPVLQDGYTINLIFSFGAVQSRARALLSSTVVSVAVPEGPWNRDASSGNATIAP